MNIIRLASVVPHALSIQHDAASEVWRQDVCFEKGKTYLIEAGSGKGKTTLCSYILGFRNDYKGRILFDKEEVCHYSVKRWIEVRRSHVSMLFQELRLFPELTALENVQIKNNLTAFKTEAQIAVFFDRLGIGDKKDAKISRMSCGQQQRVAMIRALVQPFDFIVVDEPISHLDDDNAVQMNRMLMEEARKQGAGIIVTSVGKHVDMNYDKIFKL